MAAKPAAQAAAAKVTGATPPPAPVSTPRGTSLNVPVGAPTMTAEALNAKTAVQAFRGGIVHSLALGQLQVLEDGLLMVGREKN